MDRSEQPVTGAAQRRRQRRLRSWWRHEQQLIAVALATSLHHSSRGERKARVGEEESELHYTRCSSACTKKSPAGGGWRLSLSLGRKSGSSGTSWSTSLTLCVSLPWCRFSMHLCRKWGNICRTSCLSSTRPCLILSSYRSAQDPAR